MTAPLNTPCIRVPYESEDELDRKLTLIMQKRGFTVQRNTAPLLRPGEIAAKLGMHPATVSTRLQAPGCPLPLPPHIVRGHKRIVRVALFPDLEKFLTSEKKPARS